MTEANVLDETFSVFTSKSVTPPTVRPSPTSMNRYPDVRQVQLDILMKYIGSPEIKEAFFRKMIKFGEMPHAKPVLLALCDRLAA